MRKEQKFTYVCAAKLTMVSTDALDAKRRALDYVIQICLTSNKCISTVSPCDKTSKESYRIGP